MSATSRRPAPAPVPPGATLSYTRGESLGPCRVWVNPAQPPSVSRCAPHSRSPVSLIVSFSNPARAGGDPGLSFSHPLFGVRRFLSWGAPTPPSSAGGPLHPSRTDHVESPQSAVVGSLVM